MLFAFVTTIGVVILFTLIGVGLVLFGDKLAEEDVHFTNIPKETGKVIVEGKNPVEYLFNSTSGYYGQDGEWRNGTPQVLGWIFDKTGRVFYGITPIRKVLVFSVSWGDYTEGEMGADGKRKAPTVKPECQKGITSFNRLYTHALMVNGVEMAKEEEGAGNTSTTRINLAMRLTYEITNIKDAIYKVAPMGIEFAQGDSAAQGAANDYCRGRKWEDFREEEKLPQTSEFVKHILANANPVLEQLGIGIRIKVVELMYYDLTATVANEDYEKSQMAIQIAENLGEADIVTATKQATAAKIRGKGKADELSELVAVIGADGIATYANLGQVQGTQLRVFNDKDTRVIATVNTEGEGHV